MQVVKGADWNFDTLVKHPGKTQAARILMAFFDMKVQKYGILCGRIFLESK
ncbi:MAG: hypothetical protein K2N63_01100 [Lachnospiraceae bacterium]|nr:hypothetical protein [Lachnospiraceae bacterium]